MRILGIETSCDETAASLLNIDSKGAIEIESNVVTSQIDIHKKHGGIVPEVAAREQMRAMIPVLEQALRTGNSKSQIPNNKQITNSNNKYFKHLEIPDAVAVTYGPGLVTSLRVGVMAAKTLSYIWNKPLIAINHIAGHIYSSLIPPQDNSAPKRYTLNAIHFPCLALVVSGGHTELVLMKDHGEYEYIGRTRDDAAGEAFDKVAKLLGLSYPGGPVISKYAEVGDPTAFDFPRPMIDSGDFDFSFSGLKTAVLYTLRDIDKKELNTCDSPLIANLCASFQQAVVDTLVTKTIRAAEKYNVKSFILGGGVSANQLLRSELAEAIEKSSLPIIYNLSPIKYSTDNAAMIALAGYYKYQRKKFADWKTLAANPNLKLV